MRRILVLLALAIACAFLTAANLHRSSGRNDSDPRLKGAFRLPENSGWTFVHLEGTPAQIGFQHGYLLADLIRDAEQVNALEVTHDSGKSWQFFRDAARQMFWPRIEQEYREELQGIADGVHARGVNLDLWDIVADNASEEWSYYVKQYKRQHGETVSARLVAPEHCSAFVATGSYTKDGQVVIAHNNWTGYLDGERWTMILDVKPASGHRFIMDAQPGFIHSGDDFGINDAGIAITETTISRFSGWDSDAIPEFVRARKAMQYSESVDDFARIMKAGNNGGYANDWLIADRKNGEVASLELGLKNVTLDRTRDGYFVGSNYPISPRLAREETDFNLKDTSNSANARHLRWEQLIRENKGRIDVAMAERFLGDHFDTFTGTAQPSERTLCGHIDLSSRGSQPWQPAFGDAGTVQNKTADATMMQRLTLAASAGHSCGISFKAAAYLKAHPEFGWQSPYLRDMDAHPWTMFSARDTAN